MNHITFVNYTGAFPSLCAGILTLIIDGETVTFGPSTSVEKPMNDRFWRSGGYTNWATGEVVERGWCVCADELPEQYRAALRYCGSHSGRDGDKWAASGLTTAYTDGGVPYVAQAELVLVVLRK